MLKTVAVFETKEAGSAYGMSPELYWTRGEHHKASALTNTVQNQICAREIRETSITRTRNVPYRNAMSRRVSRLIVQSHLANALASYDEYLP